MGGGTVVARQQASLPVRQGTVSRKRERAVAERHVREGLLLFKGEKNVGMFKC